MSTQHRSICPVKMNWRTDTLSAARLWFHGAMKHLIMNQLMTSSRQFMNNQNLQDKEAVVFTETEVRWHYVMIRNISQCLWVWTWEDGWCCFTWAAVQVVTEDESRSCLCEQSALTHQTITDHRSAASNTLSQTFELKGWMLYFCLYLKKHLRNTLFGLKPRCRQVYCLEMCPGLITLHYITFHYIEGI